MYVCFQARAKESATSGASEQTKRPETLPLSGCGLNLFEVFLGLFEGAHLEAEFLHASQAGVEARGEKVRARLVGVVERGDAEEDLVVLRHITAAIAIVHHRAVADQNVLECWNLAGGEPKIEILLE